MGINIHSSRRPSFYFLRSFSLAALRESSAKLASPPLRLQNWWGAQTQNFNCCHQTVCVGVARYTFARVALTPHPSPNLRTPPYNSNPNPTPLVLSLHPLPVQKFHVSNFFAFPFWSRGYPRVCFIVKLKSLSSHLSRPSRWKHP